MTYLWLKAGHVTFVIFWMAGLFMLPRFFVYHQEAEPGSPEEARWVEREQWHPDQTAKYNKDGSYVLRVPYSDERELIGDILRHGAEVEVISPQSLRSSMLQALRAAIKRYESYR